MTGLTQYLNAAGSAPPAPKLPLWRRILSDKRSAARETSAFQLFRFPWSRRRVSAGLLHVIAVALTTITALPLRSAEDHTERPIKQWVAPTYPEMARRLKVSGVVRVAATVAPDGSVTATRTVSGNHILASAAEDAVHRWKFGSAPVESTVEVNVNFTLTP
jgi:TonB family protein